MEKIRKYNKAIRIFSVLSALTALPLAIIFESPAFWIAFALSMKAFIRVYEYFCEALPYPIVSHINCAYFVCYFMGREDIYDNALLIEGLVSLALLPILYTVGVILIFI
jgi:hypothetical protein